MKKLILKIGIPVTLLLIAVFIIGPACNDGFAYYYPDNDNDSFGDSTANSTAFQVSDPIPDGYVENYTDCDDTNADVYPGATEIPDNLIDEDCNGQIAITFYVDKDEDGFGNPDNPVVIEVDNFDDNAPNGYSWFAGDCDDNNASVNPKADEIRGNDIDDNCDGEIDIVEYYIDEDGDGYGSQNFAATDDGVTNNLDCDDNNAKVHPFTKEIKDGIDNDCDGLIDEII
ncbi:putative metal-binding motif-containing protein [Lutibacter sp. A80]|uniref:putative metal-binding motif-containing protein n=1 Tax=Lutibacter sp. A80 TaxID=2918453 RepID=UPI001F0595CA|nr:putative metal-binding motif-containing protein [Lutibacter sp. A80]UMB60359.1 putative metal-binding motif-containing protein [Lutibacter sp. A80]